MVANQAKVMNQLPELTWNGLKAPCNDVSFDFSSTLAEIRVPYVDGAAHDFISRNPHQLRCHLLFLNSIEADLFPDRWGLWLSELFYGTLGDLDHPVIGPMKARVVGGSVSATARSTAGIEVDVSWVESLEDIDELVVSQSPYIDLPSVARAADAAMAAIGVPYPTGQRTTSLSDLMGQIQGLVLSARLTEQGMLNQALGILDELIDTVVAVRSVAAWPAQTNLIQLWDAVSKFKARTNEKLIRKTDVYVTTFATTLAIVANIVANAPIEVMYLNPHLLKTVAIPIGTPVKYYTKS